MTTLTATSKLTALRAAIYAAAGVSGYSKGYRPRKLRKVCSAAKGLDLRRRDHVIRLALHLGIIAAPPLRLIDGAVSSVGDLAKQAIAAMGRTDAALADMKATAASLG